MALLDRVRGLLRPSDTHFDGKVIRDRATLVEFLQVRSADVAQTVLFGYLKNRLGSQYRDVLRDPVFAAPLSTAQLQVFLDCLADLTVFAVSYLFGDRLKDDQCRFYAELLFRQGATATFPNNKTAISVSGDAFVTRLRKVDWHSAHLGENAFMQSPTGLVSAAPTIKGVKMLDPNIIMNSVRFRWYDVRRQMRDGMDVEALNDAFNRS